jgi:hypothetical protein
MVDHDNMVSVIQVEHFTADFLKPPRNLDSQEELERGNPKKCALILHVTILAIPA